MIGKTASAQPGETAAIDWFNYKLWSNGITPEPHSSINVAEFYAQYHANKILWDKVFGFFKDQNLDTIEPGNYAIDGEEAFAIITDSATKEPENCLWESHRKYIDLQYLIRGEEKMGIAAIADSEVSAPYDENKDVIFYEAEGKYYTAFPAVFFLFFSGRCSSSMHKNQSDQNSEKNSY